MTHITIIAGVLCTIPSHGWFMALFDPTVVIYSNLPICFFAENHETSHGMLVNHLNSTTIQYIGIRENLNWKP